MEENPRFARRLHIALVAAVAFSLSYGLLIVVQQKVVRGTLNPFHFNFLAYVIASIAILVYVALFDRSALKIRSLSGVGLGSLSAVVGTTADMLVLFGLQHSSSINYSILSRLSVIITFVLAVIFLKEKINLSKLSAIFISIVGALLVVYRPHLSFLPASGDILFLSSVVAFGITNTIQQKALEVISIAQLTLVRITVGALVLSIPVIFFYPLTHITSWGFIVFSAASIITGITLVNVIIQKSSASFFAVSGNLVPVFTAILAVIFLREPVSILQVAGGVLVIVSIFLFHFRR